MRRHGADKSDSPKGFKGWLSRNKELLFGGVSATIVGIALTMVFEHYKKDSGGGKNITVGDIDAQGGRDVEIVVGDKTGLSGKDVADIVEKIVAQGTREKEELFQKIGNLEEQLAGALQRAAKAEARGDVPDAEGVIEELRETGDTKRLLDVLIRERDSKRDSMVERNREIAAVAYLRGDMEIARTAVDEILKINPDDVDALTQKGLIKRLQGNLDEAEKLFSRVLEIGLADGSDHWQAVGSGNLGLIYQTRGELDKAEEMYGKSLEIAEKLGLQKVMASQYGNLGVIYFTRRELDKAEEMYKKALEISERIGWLEGMAINYAAFGLVYFEQGDLKNAEEWHLKGLEIEEKIGRLDGIARQYCNLGNVYVKRGELDEAEEMHKKSLAVEKRIGRLEGMARQYCNLGMICEKRGDLRKAKEYLEKARDLYKKIGLTNEVKKVEGWMEGLDGKQRTEDGGRN
jgi:tetratricopeptide (TPR) repeat protein